LKTVSLYNNLNYQYGESISLGMQGDLSKNSQTSSFFFTEFRPDISFTKPLLNNNVSRYWLYILQPQRTHNCGDRWTMTCLASGQLNARIRDQPHRRLYIHSSSMHTHHSITNTKTYRSAAGLSSPYSSVSVCVYIS
jgi:hypothetical protein